MEVGDGPNKIELIDSQHRELERLWFIYGNHGKFHTHAGHRFIQCLLEEGVDHRNFFKPGIECTKAVDDILKGDQE